MGADIEGEATYDRSGRSVSLSSDGKTVAIGAPYNDGIGNNSGHVRVYNFQDHNSTWVQLGADINGEAAGDQSGSSVSLSLDGKTVAIGATINDGIGSDSGHVRVYQFDNSSWVQLGANINGEAAYDWSGRSVSLSLDGRTVAIGAHGNDDNGSNSGHVQVYTFQDNFAWVQLGDDIVGEAASDFSGGFVSLSSDGKTVAIGAGVNDGNGNNSGHVRVYQFDDSSWVQLGADIDGEATYDQSGRSVSLSSDGKTVAIGAPYNDGNGSESGHVRVYHFPDC